jgi:phosphatidylethanolamine/phosphatidyl-N-methylethanolamine N-methyltransferase
MLGPAAAKSPKSCIRDELRFFLSWLKHPLQVGGIAPASPALARAMAAEVDPGIPGPLLELGPGTGVITEALVARGIAPERLVLLEYSPEFCALLRERYPRAKVIEGDAYRLGETLAGIVDESLAAVVSGLPLLTRPLAVRERLLAEALRRLTPGAPFVQYSYGPAAPIPARPGRYSLKGSPRVWRNLPPARVWVYRNAR